MYICDMEYTLTQPQTLILSLTSEELKTLSEIMFFEIDSLQYEVERQTKDNDPDGELEDITNTMISAMDIQKKLSELSKTLQ